MTDWLAAVVGGCLILLGMLAALGNILHVHMATFGGQNIHVTAAAAHNEAVSAAKQPVVPVIVIQPSQEVRKLCTPSIFPSMQIILQKRHSPL